MIVVKLMGGLGNQMFQYAFGRHLSVKNNTELKLDLSYLTDSTHKKDFIQRKYELGVFKINASLASEQDILKFKIGRKRKILHHLSLYFPVQPENFYLREPYFHFFKRALTAPGNTYADGYWQSEKYFLDSSEQIKKDFTSANPLSGRSIRLKEEIKKNQSASIHVRRADYITLRHLNRYHTCNEKYYSDAMELIGSRISKPKFYVFSDEPGWFEKNVITNFPVEYIEHNPGVPGYEDIYLMSLCKHNIIANSTFSWWGAWLNENVGKIVVAPQKWFIDKTKNPKDIIPQSWIKL
jgi:hypothetical protein